MRLACWLAAVLAAVAAKAEVTVFDHLPSNLRHATITAQAQGRDWGVMWNVADSANYDMAWFALVPDARHVDATFPMPAQLVVRSVRGGVVSDSQPIEVADIDTRRVATIKIVYDGYAARLYAGADDLAMVGEVPMSAEAHDVAFVNDGKAKMLRAEALYFALPQPQRHADGDIEALRSRLSASTDPAEGVWQHMDRDITAPVTLGGKYTLATVRDGDRYLILYLEGDDSPQSMFSPLDIKGVLTPTIFKGNYDLWWQCADGRALSDDAYATIDDNHAILTLHFPVEKATVRLRRIPLTKAASE